MNIMRLMAYFPAMQICLSRDIPTSPRLLYPPPLLYIGVHGIDLLNLA
ncbi:Uncharacterised protein [Atlantibacter hermannii]|nr:Uncharacterised protein [Atlantibacter hermannii]